MSTSSTNSSLRPAWQSRGNQGGGRGFQPPPQVATERANNNPRSQSFGSGGGSGHHHSNQHHPQRTNSSHTDSKNDAENNRRDSSNFNKFAALDDDDDLVAEATATTTSTTVNSSNNNKSSGATTSNSRSEGFRNAVLSGIGTSTTNTSNTSGTVARNISSSRTGMSLTDLVANTPERERSGSISGSGRYGAGRSNSIGENRNELTTTSSTETSAAPAAPPVKVTRFTRERLLSMRPRPLDKPSAKLVQIAGESKSAILTDEPQDPVCWDTFDAEEIWATVAAASAVRRATSTGPGKGGPPPLGSTSTGIPSEDASAIRRSVSTGLTRNTSRGESSGAASGGRWQRGVALPPPDQTIRKSGTGSNRDREAEDPSDLWDDPGSATDGGAAADFSAFGSTIPKIDANDSGGTADNAVFDFDRMTEATKKFEEELHGSARSRTSSTGAVSDADVDDTGTGISKIRVDPKRPLASVGTTIRSGSGDDVNVFEDFDDPASSEGEPDETNADTSKVDKETTTTTTATTRTTPSPPPAIKAIDEDPDASSRLMALIGIKKDEPSSILGGPDPIISSLLAAPSTAPGPAMVGNVIEPPKLSSTWGLPDPLIAPKVNESGPVLGLSLNPWGGPMLNSVEPMHGLDLQARLRDAEVEQQKAREEELRRRQEQEEAQRRVAQQQAEQERVRLQQLQQQQQGVGVQSQVENVLMERISAILENSWGRSDLVSILTTLHAEDSRVIPLLSTVDALRALLLRNPQRVAIRQDPALRAEMAALLITNAQWQQRQQQQAAAAAAAAQQQLLQQQRLRAQQEELQRREQQRRLEEQQQQQQQQAAAAARAAQQQQRQQQGVAPILPDAPWYYSDPQKNIQGPFRGDEMRQWLEAGYFKGDLPISQQPVGPFRPLSAIFPDFTVAFTVVATNPPLADNRAARAAAEERTRIEVAEQQAQAEAAAAAAERERFENERRAKEVERRAREAAAERQRMLVEREQQQQLEQQRLAQEAEANESDKPSSVNGSNGGNESSAQLKMLLGLNSQFAKRTESQVSAPVASTTTPAPAETVPTPSTTTMAATTTKTTPPAAASTKPATEKKTPKTSNKVVSHPSAPEAAPVPATLTPAAPAWGGAAVNKTAARKTMSEIQKEEARAAANAAMRQDSKPSSSGWANVAAARGGSSAWAGGAATQKPAVVLLKPTSSIAVAATTATRAPTRVTSSGSAPVASSQAPMQRSVSASGNSTSGTGTSVAPADAFGAKMSPQLEKWCKDQMQKLNGTDDLTLVSFCMTLSDPVEIRQYITTYLGTTPQVNNFATEFINRTQKGGSMKEKTEEWESTVAVNKKNRKKKPTAGGTATANR